MAWTYRTCLSTLQGHESEAENSGRNPDYVKDHGYGHRMPKKSLYRDESYFNDFGIKYDADGNGVATKNVEQWNMIQKLKEIKRQSLDLYKEQSPNHRYPNKI